MSGGWSRRKEGPEDTEEELRELWFWGSSAKIHHPQTQLVVRGITLIKSI